MLAGKHMAFCRVMARGGGGGLTISSVRFMCQPFGTRCAIRGQGQLQWETWMSWVNRGGKLPWDCQEVGW